MLQQYGRSQAVLELELPSGRVVWASEGAARLFQAEAQALQGRYVGELRPAWVEDHTGARLAALAAGTGDLMDLGVPWLRGDGEVWWADVLGLRREQPGAARALLFLTNASDRRRVAFGMTSATARTADSSESGTLGIVEPVN